MFDEKAAIVAVAQKEHRQIFPRPGWVEPDATAIWENVRDCVHVALARAGISRHGLAAIGITNQRETCVLWDRATGRPNPNQTAWQETRGQPRKSGVDDRVGGKKCDRTWRSTCEA